MARQVAARSCMLRWWRRHDGDVEAHVLIGFGYVDDGEVAAEGGGGIGQVVESAEEFAGADDGGVVCPPWPRRRCRPGGG